MNNIFLGILIVFICSIGYYFSWKFQTRSNFKISVLLLVLSGLALRIYTSTDFYLHTWDERYHALVAKNLIQHPLKPTLYDRPLLPYDYKNWTANNIWLHKQPLSLWAMALSMSLFGVNEIALRLPSIILSTIGISLTFSIASYLLNKKVGYLAAFFYSINGLIIELTGGRVPTDHVDIFYLFFIELAIYLTIKFAQERNTGYNILAGVSLGAAILTKWLPALIVVPIWILIVMDSNNINPRKIIFHFIVFMTACVLISLPWQLYTFKMFTIEANWEASYNFKHFTEVIEGHAGSFNYYINKIRINYGELIYLPILWFSWKTFTNIKDKRRFSVFILFIIPFLFFSIAKTKMQAYILFICPALFMMTAEFWYMVSEYKTNHKPKWLFNLVLFLLIALPIRYTIERVKPFTLTDRNPRWVTDLKAISKKNISNGVLFNYDKPIEGMFYTNLIVYPNIPDKLQISDLMAHGYTVIINENGNIPAEINEIEGIIKENLTTTPIAMTNFGR